MSSYNDAISSLLRVFAASVNRASRCRLSGILELILLIVAHGVLVSRARQYTFAGLAWFFSPSLKRRFCGTSKNDLLFFSLSWIADWSVGCMISNDLILRCLSISWKTSDQLWKSSRWIIILMIAVILVLRVNMSNAFIIISLENCICMWLTDPCEIPRVAQFAHYWCRFLNKIEACNQGVFSQQFKFVGYDTFDPLFFSLSWMADGLGCMISNNLMFLSLLISWENFWPDLKIFQINCFTHDGGNNHSASSIEQ